MSKIPPRNPVGDRFSGVLLRYSTADLLAKEIIEGTELIASGNFILRYGVRYLEKPHLSIVPGLVAVDYGEMLTGEAMWEFILTRINQYPRAEVFGYRNDGEEDMIVLKKLDVDRGFQVLAYDEAQVQKPIAKPIAGIFPDDAQLEPRISNYLPRYNTLDDWKKRDRT